MIARKLIRTPTRKAECSTSGEVRAPRSRLHVDPGGLLRYLDERVSISRRTTRSISATAAHRSTRPVVAHPVTSASRCQIRSFAPAPTGGRNDASRVGVRTDDLHLAANGARGWPATHGYRASGAGGQLFETGDPDRLRLLAAPPGSGVAPRTWLRHHQSTTVVHPQGRDRNGSLIDSSRGSLEPHTILQRGKQCRVPGRSRTKVGDRDGRRSRALCQHVCASPTERPGRATRSSGAGGRRRTRALGATAGRDAATSPATGTAECPLRRQAE